MKLKEKGFLLLLKLSSLGLFKGKHILWLLFIWFLSLGVCNWVLILIYILEFWELYFGICENLNYSFFTSCAEWWPSCLTKISGFFLAMKRKKYHVWKGASSIPWKEGVCKIFSTLQRRERLLCLTWCV